MCKHAPFRGFFEPWDKLTACNRSNWQDDCFQLMICYINGPYPDLNYRHQHLLQKKAASKCEEGWGDEEWVGVGGELSRFSSLMQSQRYSYSFWSQTSLPLYLIQKTHIIIFLWSHKLMGWSSLILLFSLIISLSTNVLIYEFIRVLFLHN